MLLLSGQSVFYQESDSDEVFLSSTLECSSSKGNQSLVSGNATSSTLYITALEENKTIEPVSSQGSSAVDMGKCEMFRRANLSC